jgi:NADPH:quinone reductase-like Zn-dependent oxidoreductase
MQFNSSSKAIFKKSLFSISCIIFLISAAVHISALFISSSTLRMPSNTAAWLAAKASPLEVKPAPYTSLRENEIIIKNGAVAINPVDWAIQDTGEACFPGSLAHAFSPQPSLVRSFELGSAVSRFKLGDRALGFPATLRENESSKGAFQACTILAAHMASQIPSTLSYESAAVLPLGLSTAACGLFQKDYLALQSWKALEISPPTVQLSSFEIKRI